jgi:hypothetical protein
MRLGAWFAMGVVGFGLGLAGCDWRDFDNLQAQAPVLSVGPPSGFATSNDFGGVVLALSSPSDGSAAARFLATAVDTTGLALVDLDATGKASSQNITSGVLDSLGNEPLTAMAEIPLAGEVLLGSPALSGGTLLTLNLTTLVVSQFVFAAEPQFAMGVAAGSLGGTAAPDFVAVSGSAVHVFLDGASSPDLVAADSAACPLAVSTSLPSSERINRAVVIGTLTGAGAQIIVGTPALSGGGSVSFFTVDATAGTVTCAQRLTAAESQFGQAVAIGDFDGDGVSDLLVGAPPSHAYLYKGPIAPGAAPTATITDASTGGAFGAALVALNLDGEPGDEALIADPEATVGGQMRAGNVLVFSGPALATKGTTTLAAHDPSSGEAYGSALGALPFCATMPCPASPPRLPLVGAAAQVFTYFDLGLGSTTDPRAK